MLETPLAHVSGILRYICCITAELCPIVLASKRQEFIQANPISDYTLTETHAVQLWKPEGFHDQSSI